MSSASAAEIEGREINELRRIALIRSLSLLFSIIFKQIIVLNFISPPKVLLRLLLEHLSKLNCKLSECIESCRVDLNGRAGLRARLMFHPADETANGKNKTKIDMRLRKKISLNTPFSLKRT